MQLDCIEIGASDLVGASRDYELLLGVAPAADRDGVLRFQLGRGAVELQSGGPGIQSLRFVPSADDREINWPADTESFHGIAVHVDAPFDGPVRARAADAIDAIDHVVIHSPDLDRAIALWRDRLGLRLALDREFPERGLRLLFFRSGGITLEFAGTLQKAQDVSGSDRLYGVAYRVGDLEACRTRLLRAGFEVTAIRPGHKRGTRVATVRSRTAEVPTLLIAEAASGD